MTISKYIPLLRSGKHLTLQLGVSRARYYAASSIRFPLDVSAGIDFMTATHLVRKELERLLGTLESV